MRAGPDLRSASSTFSLRHDAIEETLGYRSRLGCLPRVLGVGNSLNSVVLDFLGVQLRR